MKEKILSIVPEAILEEKHGIWFVSVPRTSFHDLALRLRNDRMIAIERRKMIAILADGEMNPFLLRLVPRKIAKQIASLR